MSFGMPSGSRNAGKDRGVATHEDSPATSGVHPALGLLSLTPTAGAPQPPSSSSSSPSSSPSLPRSSQLPPTPAVSPDPGRRRDVPVSPQPLPSRSSPAVADGEGGPALTSSPLLLAPHLWKTPFWILEDFQAPRPLPKLSAQSSGPAQDRAPSESAQPSPGPYYPLEPADLEAFRIFHPPSPPRLRDSELMNVPPQDIEFWGRFYFSGAEQARELLEQRARAQKIQ
ncbi:uncharacterized protein LOC129697602 [Leucoraja erinacea]|uniref:uncharacterized protein LOC129697602 n=1 Tax=Leucoraja erinaceus TaxID=7782 RepID=UPI0024551540|nr:uncharacterized protein LOC129697602 [Leucoraja erinacea]